MNTIITHPNSNLKPGLEDIRAIAQSGRYRAAMALQQMEDLLRHGRPKEEPPGRMTSEIKPLFDQDAFCAMVRRAKHHICEGDIFQIVLSNRLEAGDLSTKSMVLCRKLSNDSHLLPVNNMI